MAFIKGGVYRTSFGTEALINNSKKPRLAFDLTHGEVIPIEEVFPRAFVRMATDEEALQAVGNQRKRSFK
jgi:predicted dienelactone hydrolase